MSSSSLVSLPPPNVSIAPHPRLSQAHLASFSFIFFFMHNTSHVHPGGSYLRTNQTFITTLSTASLTRPGGPHHIPLPNSYRSCSASIAAEDLQRIELFFFFFYLPLILLLWFSFLHRVPFTQDTLSSRLSVRATVIIQKTYPITSSPRFRCV